MISCARRLLWAIPIRKIAMLRPFSLCALVLALFNRDLCGSFVMLYIMQIA